MKLVKLLDINKPLERGTKIRLMNNGLDMHPDDSNQMILVNITENSHKAGALINGIFMTEKGVLKRVLSIESIKKVFGRDFKHCYLHLDE